MKQNWCQRECVTVMGSCQKGSVRCGGARPNTQTHLQEGGVEVVAVLIRASGSVSLIALNDGAVLLLQIAQETLQRQQDSQPQPRRSRTRRRRVGTITCSQYTLLVSP